MTVALPGFLEVEAAANFGGALFRAGFPAAVSGSSLPEIGIEKLEQMF